MTCKWKPYPYQEIGIDHIIDRWMTSEGVGAGLLSDPGLGKTGMYLTAIDTMMAMGEVSQVLVVAPLRTIQSDMSTWPAHIMECWPHLSYATIHGTPNKRVKALYKQADIHLINIDGVSWLSKQKLLGNWDLVLCDESHNFKNFVSKRSRAMRKIVAAMGPDVRRGLATGTIIPQCYSDLHSQIHLLDDGEALGKTKGYFQGRFMQQQRSGDGPWQKWVLRPGAQEEIDSLIGDMLIKQTVEEYGDMPRYLQNIMWVELTGRAKNIYKDMERLMFADIAEGKTVIAKNGGGKYHHCKGIASGSMYLNHDDGTRETVDVHTQKIDAIDDRIGELNGKPVVIVYQYWHELDRLKRKFGEHPAINSKSKRSEFDGIMRNWQAGRTPILYLQPLSGGEGLDGLQKGGHDMIFMGLGDRGGQFTQTVARVYRQGQNEQVRIHIVLTRGTVDEVVLERAMDKKAAEEWLGDSLKRYRLRKLEQSSKSR